MLEKAPSRLPSHHPEPEAFMRYFQPPADTRFYAGVDLHARSLFLSILDRDGQERFARNLIAAPAPACASSASAPSCTATSTPPAARPTCRPMLRMPRELLSGTRNYGPRTTANKRLVQLYEAWRKPDGHPLLDHFRGIANTAIKETVDEFLRNPWQFHGDTGSRVGRKVKMSCDQQAPQSWLNIAENELSAMTRQCITGRVSRRGVEEPATAGGVAVEPNGLAGSQAKVGLGQVDYVDWHRPS
jgi:hypothetical protein